MGVKVTKVVVVDDAGAEQILNVIDGTMLVVCEGLTSEQTRVLTQTTANNNINMELVRRLFAPVAAPAQAEAPAVPAEPTE